MRYDVVQRRLRSGCAKAQPDMSLHCPMNNLWVTSYQTAYRRNNLNKPHRGFAWCMFGALYCLLWLYGFINMTTPEQMNNLSSLGLAKVVTDRILISAICHLLATVDILTSTVLMFDLAISRKALTKGEKTQRVYHENANKHCRL